MTDKPIPLLQDMDAQNGATIRNLKNAQYPGDAVSKSFMEAAIEDAAGGGSSTSVTLTAQGAISGHKAIVMLAGRLARYPSIATATDADLIVGVSTGAAADGGEVPVRLVGEIDEPSWNWTPGPIFAGDNGVLTQSPPSGAWIRQVGVAVAPTIMVVNLRPTFITA